MQTVPHDNDADGRLSDLRPPKGKLRDSFVHAWAGFAYVLCSERNPRIYMAATALVVALGFWLHLNAREWALVIVAIAFVFA